jgi:hypothetical protein
MSHGMTNFELRLIAPVISNNDEMSVTIFTIRLRVKMTYIPKEKKEENYFIAY